MNKAGRPGTDGLLDSATGSVAAPARPHILVIEDSADIRYFLAALLESRYEVLVADSGEAGLEMARANMRPELILLDVMMPVMDGYEVMAQLRRDPRTADIPVIFLTALSSVEEEQRGLDLGATDYITKPISPPIVLARVHTHLERSTNSRRLSRTVRHLLMGTLIVSVAVPTAMLAAPGQSDRDDHDRWDDDRGRGEDTPIRHVVVIFQENVSFDHYFATYPRAINSDGSPSEAVSKTYSWMPGTELARDDLELA